MKRKQKTAMPTRSAKTRSSAPAPQPLAPTKQTKSYKPSGHAVASNDKPEMKKVTPGKKVMEGRKGTLQYPKKKKRGVGMDLKFGKNYKKS